MYIFIDHYDVVEAKKIISILDYQLIETSIPLQQLIKDRKQHQQLIGNEEEAKSIIITDDHIYLSSLSTYTLKKREGLASSMSYLDKYEYER